MKLIDLLVKELPKSGGWPKEAVTAIYFSHKQGVTFYDKDGMGIKNGVSFICMDIYGVQREEVTKEEFEAALAKNDGWIKVMPGEYPVNISTVIDVKFDDGSIIYGMAIKGSKWHGATHYRLHRDINSRANDDRLENDLNECIGQDVDPAWCGEGLPPVGTICEALMPALDNTLLQWRIVKVVESGAPGAEKEVLAYDIENTKPAWTDEFRPLRTELEKAREAAEKLAVADIIREMKMDVNSLQDVIIAQKLYRAVCDGKIRGVNAGEK